MSDYEELVNRYMTDFKFHAAVGVYIRANCILHPNTRDLEVVASIEECLNA